MDSTSNSDPLTDHVTNSHSHPEPLHLREPITPKSLPFCSNYEYLERLDEEGYNAFDKRIKFAHPAYDWPKDHLFSLPAFDHAEGGIHHGFAKAICAIFADNRYDGYFSLSREANAPDINVGIDDVLKAGNCYYYHVPPAHDDQPLPYKWPVVTEFSEWQFPHHDVPKRWKLKTSKRDPTWAINVKTAAEIDFVTRSPGDKCQITGSRSRDGVQICHIVPKYEWYWFRENGMFHYKALHLPLDLDIERTLDPANSILFRADLHISWANGNFVIYPLNDKGDLAIHYLRMVRDETEAYHNLKIHGAR